MYVIITIQKKNYWNRIKMLDLFFLWLFKNISQTYSWKYLKFPLLNFVPGNTLSLFKIVISYEIIKDCF